MKKLFKFTICLLVILLLVGCSAKETVTFESKEFDKVQNAVKEFFKTGDEIKHVKMTSTMGEMKSSFLVDGDKMLSKYGDDVAAYYMFIENGRKYVMYDGDEPVEDEGMYDLSLATVSNMIDMVVNIFSNPEAGTTAEGKIVKTGNTENLTARLNLTDEALLITGVKENGKITLATIIPEINGETKEDDSFKFEFDYANYSVTIPDHTIPEARVYNHIEPPYKNISEVIPDVSKVDNIPYTIDNDGVIYLPFVIDGKGYQFSAKLSEEQINTLTNLEFDDNYNANLYNVIKDVAFGDCVDFTDYLLNDEMLSGYVGATVEDLINAGFESNGYSVSEDSSVVWVGRDVGVYEASIELPEGFDTEADFEFENLYNAKLKEIHFSELNSAAFPLN